LPPLVVVLDPTSGRWLSDTMWRFTGVPDFGSESYYFFPRFTLDKIPIAGHFFRLIMPHATGWHWARAGLEAGIWLLPQLRGERIAAEVGEFASAVEAAEGVVDAAKVLGEGLDVGYHATRAENVGSILENGLRESLGGRAGSGVYVSDTIEGAMAEFAAHNPGITPAVLKVGYSPASNYYLEGLTNSYIKGALPLGADTLSFQSVRLAGSVNVVIRNGSSVVLGVAF
jgi:hypothetical protein